MSKISQYTALPAPQGDDLLPVVDVHDATMAATGTTKTVEVGSLPFDAAGSAAAAQAAAEAASVPLAGTGGFPLPSPGPVSRRPAWRQATWFQDFQAGHGWTTGGSPASSALNDTSVFCRGTQCATVTTSGTATQASIRVVNGPAVSMTGSALRLTFMVTNAANLNRISFYLGTGGFANYFVLPVTAHSAGAQNMVEESEWVTLTVGWAAVQSASGTYSLSAVKVPSVTSGFTDLQFAVYDSGTGPVTVHLQSAEIIPDTASAFPKGVVSIVTDDSFENFWTYGRPVMDSYGYRGTSYTIAGAIGTPGYMTLAQLQQMQDCSGWEVGGHAYTLAAHNAGYETLTAAQVTDEMRFLRAWMLNSGFGLDSFAYPSGWFSATTDGVPVDRICARYFSTGRSIISEVPETFPPAMPYRVRSLTGITSPGITTGTQAASVTAAGGPLDRCANSADWLILTFHQVVASGATASTQVNQADFAAVLAGISSRGIPVLPVADVIREHA